MLDALGLFALIEAVGLLAAPVAALLLGRLPGAGLGFNKTLGLLLVTWFVWMAASLHVVAYGVPLIVGGLVLLAVAGLLCAWRGLRRRLEGEGEGLPRDDHVRRRLFLGAEAVFAVTYALG